LNQRDDLEPGEGENDHAVGEPHPATVEGVDGRESKGGMEGGWHTHGRMGGRETERQIGIERERERRVKTPV